MQYKNIIFDLGNVLVKLNSLGCMNAFKVLGMEKLIDSNPEAKRLMGELGVGLISTEQFCDAARNLTLTTVSNHQIIEAANRMLVVIPDEKKRRLLKLKAKGYRLFLLSNTIDIHWDYCVEKLFPYQGIMWKTILKKSSSHSGSISPSRMQESTRKSSDKQR